jgi:ATP-dependent helicase/nuclease subunit A
MTDDLRTRVVSSFSLTQDQQAASLERGHDVVVTAGAGSGKTRTLVARYASLLAEGCTPRSAVAITFTEKAAREMRSRVRDALASLAVNAASPEERQRWVDLGSAMDSARIGTIHSLCAEMMRAHPVEAAVDPKFDVVDEGESTVLKGRAVEETLAGLVGMQEFAPLFTDLQVSALKELLAFLLDHRLEAQEAFSRPFDNLAAVGNYLSAALASPAISGPVKSLRGMNGHTLQRDAGDGLAAMVEELLGLWVQAEKALRSGDVVACAGYLYRARREKMKGNIGFKISLAKESVKELQSAYDELINPLTGGKAPKDPVPDAASEKRFNLLGSLAVKAFGMLMAAYRASLDRRGGIDFDDLEDGAARLMQIPAVRTRWQAETSALLVDEFQDTNDRQRRIVEGLSGAPGRLFVVGDARQSIYRFRRADVTVFRSVIERVRAQGGKVIDLDKTYRAHKPLLDATGDLLGVVMGTEDDPRRPFLVPFTGLKAVRETAPEHIHGPHIEFTLCLGANTEEARPAAARALALRLAELKEAEQIKSWDDVALLFRATTGFSYYENAFEDAGIPFVTVAGRGFYDRPEIRDLVNILRALANPADDLAMAGLLRSPAFGLSDAALFQLRCRGGSYLPYREALRMPLPVMDESDTRLAARAAGLLGSLLPMVDRVPVAELLKTLVDLTDYRAILAAGSIRGTDGRLWRNLDKLLSDARESGQVNVRDFLDYLSTVNTAGVREGEAPAEAEGSVRLMTIHKSKGLEFPVVVLADASRLPRVGSSLAFLLPETGLAFRTDPQSMLYRLTKIEDRAQDDAEVNRLIYVALTRAKDKLIISGHITGKEEGNVTSRGWLDRLALAAGLDLASLEQQEGNQAADRTASGQEVRGWLLKETGSAESSGKEESKDALPEGNTAPIFAPLEGLEDSRPVEEEIWDAGLLRATGPHEHIPPGVTGHMAHKALELWLFPGNPRLQPMLEAAALNEGLAMASQRRAAVRHTILLLERLYGHPLRQEIEQAKARYHELPYSRKVEPYLENGVIDVLYDTGDGWEIVDFKTDSIRGAEEMAALLAKYTGQLRRYASAVEALVGSKARARICFLDSGGQVELVSV